MGRCCRNAQMPPLKRCHMALGSHWRCTTLSSSQVTAAISIFHASSSSLQSGPAVTLQRSTKHSFPTCLYTTAHPPRTGPAHRADSAGMQQRTHTRHNNCKPLTSPAVSTLPSRPHTYNVNRHRCSSSISVHLSHLSTSGIQIQH